MNKSTAMALTVAAHVAYMVLIPLVVLGGLGLLADREFHTLPRLLLVGLAVAFSLTVYWLVKMLRPIIETIQKGQ